MFEDSLIESKGRIRTHSRWLAIGSFFLQAALLVLLVLFPLMHPLALPRQSLERLLVAPSVPRLPAHVQAQRSAATSSLQSMPSLQTQLQAPRAIPATAANTVDIGPPGSPIGDISWPGDTHLPGGLDFGSRAPTVTVARPPTQESPIHLSSGVSAGLLLSPIRAVYPAIAKQARIRGTVVIEATISRLGMIENLQITEGPPMLRQAAIDAVAQARYRPFLLNGEPVEVQTSIRVIFSFAE